MNRFAIGDFISGIAAGCWKAFRSALALQLKRMYPQLRQQLDQMGRHAAGAKILDNEVLVAGKIVAQELKDDVIHGLRMKDATSKRKQENDEGEERQDGVGGYGEGVGVNLGLHEIACGWNGLATNGREHC